MPQLVANNAASTLASGITNVATSLTVATGEGNRFPVAGGADYFHLTLQDGAGNIEIVRVTARTLGSDSMTVTRGQEGTTARAWSAGAIIGLRATAGLMAPLAVMEGASTAATIRTRIGAEAAFPSGTRMLFVQTAAPTGWTKDTTHNDKALRVVSGTAGSGGTRSFSTTFEAVARSTSSVTATGTVGSTTLSTSQIPSHLHVYNGLLINNTNAFIINDGGGDNMAISDNAVDGVNGANPKNLSAGGGGSHNHSLTMDAHSHTIDLALAYVDVIIATKD